MGNSKKIKVKLPRTAAQIYELLPHGTPAEVIDNTIYMSPAPSFEHQTVVGDVFFALESRIRSTRSGICVISPVDVHIDENNIVQPDVVYISNASRNIIKKGKIRGVPDLLIEVLSPGNEKHDLERKKKCYEKAGVKEYYVITASSRLVTCYMLSGGKYKRRSTVRSKLISEVLGTTIPF